MKRVILLILVGVFIFANGKSEILDLKTRVLNGDSTNQIQLSESLQGDYEFDLVCRNYCFYSDITL